MPVDTASVMTAPGGIFVSSGKGARNLVALRTSQVTFLSKPVEEDAAPLCCEPFFMERVLTMMVIFGVWTSFLGSL